MAKTGVKIMKDNDILAEVKRYGIDGFDGVGVMGDGPYVGSEDYDAAMAREAALQQRVDLLEGLLCDALLYLPSHGIGSVTFELNKRIISALKPAEGGSDV